MWPRLEGIFLSTNIWVILAKPSTVCEFVEDVEFWVMVELPNQSKCKWFQKSASQYQKSYNISSYPFKFNPLNVQYFPIMAIIQGQGWHLGVQYNEICTRNSSCEVVMNGDIIDWVTQQVCNIQTRNQLLMK